MQIATWNVNSVRARLPRLLEWLERRKPDVVLLQETKCLDEAFPWEPLQDAGYNCAHWGQKTYNGVGILSRRRIEDVVRGMSEEAVEGEERRVLCATVEDVMFVNLYVINGQEVGAPRYFDKLMFLSNLREWLAQRCNLAEKIVVAGDFNITFDDRDVHDPQQWHEKILCSTPERHALEELVGIGLEDAFRKFHPEGGHYTWWDFRTRGFERGQGLRIDHMLMSPPALAACESVEIDLEARSGEKPSDHAPLIARLR
jgi:exodeoxyribonuclease III